MALAYTQSRSYFSSNNRQTDLRSVYQTGEQKLQFAWSGIVGPISVRAGTDLAFGRDQPVLGPALSLSYTLPDSFAAISLGGRRTYAETVEAISLKDFTASFRERVTLMELEGSASVRPVRPLTMRVDAAYENGDSEGHPSGDGLNQESDHRKIRLTAAYGAPADDGIAAAAEYGELMFPTELQRDATQFGRLQGKVYSRRFFLQARWEGMGLRLAPAISYSRWNGSFVGHAESWPFTPLAASVFQNRIYGRGSGSVSLWCASATAEVRTGSVKLSPGLAYYRAASDLEVERWGPEFLVFGVKNYRKDPVGFRQARLLSVELGLDFPLWGLLWQAGIRQIIPISIGYASIPGGPPSESGSAGSAVRVDGGRRYVLSVKF